MMKKRQRVYRNEVCVCVCAPTHLNIFNLHVYKVRISMLTLLGDQTVSGMLHRRDTQSWNSQKEFIVRVTSGDTEARGTS